MIECWNAGEVSLRGMVESDFNYTITTTQGIIDNIDNIDKLPPNRKIWQELLKKWRMWKTGVTLIIAGTNAGS